VKQQVAWISIGQAAKIFVFIYAVLFVGLSVIFSLIGFALSGPSAMMEVLPIFFVYSVLSYILTILACVVYNAAAQRVGGITISLTPIAGGEAEAQ